MKSIIVTGGAGFIGSNLVSHLSRSFPDSSILVIDKNPLQYEAAPGHRPIQSAVVDLENYPELVDHLKTLKNTNACIYHLAAQTSAEISMHRPLLDVTTNLLGLTNLLEALDANGVDVGHFVFTSSMGVYGHQSNAEHSGFSVVNTRPNPVSVYGATKLMSEKHLQSLGIPLSIVRLFNVYGPGQDFSNMMQGMVSIYVAQLVREQKITVKGSLNRTRDLCYVDDVSMSLVEIGKNPPDGSVERQLLNLGTGLATDISTLTQKILQEYEALTGIKGTVITTEGTAGDMPYSFDADSGILNYVASPTGLESGLRKILQDAIIQLT